MSPHERGFTGALERLQIARVICPARAGMQPNGMHLPGEAGSGDPNALGYADGGATAAAGATGTDGGRQHRSAGRARTIGLIVTAVIQALGYRLPDPEPPFRENFLGL